MDSFGYRLSVLLSLVLLLVTCGETEKARDQEPQAKSVEITEVRPMRLQETEPGIGTFEALESVQLAALDNLVTIQEQVGPSEIHHYNRGRAVTISAQTPPGVPLGTALTRLQEHLDQALPAGFAVEIAGQAQDFRESFLHPFTILLTMPLAGLGAFGALYLLGMTFKIFSFIGIIFLTGLVTKTGILLVDYSNVLAARGLALEEAVRQAAETRFRPVLMTAASTILGMLPIAMGYGAGGTARAPLGVAVSMGNLVSTALTLLVVPVAYLLLNDLQAFILRHRRAFLAATAIVAAGAGAAVWWFMLKGG
ncbi:MAG: efflux RND transporter permease subunit [Desulfuromonadales bacterium]|nr:efflux RND transporter permease subunit [Desulfuromonadales bacterium]MDT8444206.1 efflux RND transporter permease subunit [Desulfuromonadales bacterium]